MGELFKSVVDTVSTYAIPLLLFVIPVLAFIKRVKIYEEFI
jgi:hypothetical protein